MSFSSSSLPPPIPHLAPRRGERGNVLVFILIAIVLFAALSYVVGNMMRGGGSGHEISTERARALAAEIVDYGRSLRQNIQAMRISNGCADTDISFETAALSGYSNGSNTMCQIFHPNGGGMNYIAPAPDVLANISPVPSLYGEWYFTGGVCAMGLGQDPGICNDDNKDIVAFLPFITRATCIAINNALGIQNPSGNPPVENANGWPPGNEKFAGAFTGSVQLNRGGQMAGCFEGNNASSTPPSGTYHFFQVLLIR